MATMHPIDIENYNYMPSEKKLYDELDKQLPEKYHVFYSVRWFETVSGKRVDSESDFIIFDPSFGFITVEVKGGKHIDRNGEEWYLTETVDGQESVRKLKCSPYEQAEKSMRHFHKYFHEEFNQSFNGVYGFAVAFPWYSSESIISSSSPRELTIDLNDMDNLREKINQIFHYWKNKRNLLVPFSSEQRERFIRLINKRISLSAAAGALIPIHAKELNKINAVQDSILDAVYYYSDLQFIGGAGTGKTFIGAKKAIREAQLGKRALYTCCSKLLVDYVKTVIIGEKANVVCMTFDELMQNVFGEEYDVLAATGNGFFDALNKLDEKEKYECIIVDEAQDYDIDMGLSMRALLTEDYSTFYVFFDENQNVFGKDFENSFAIDFPPVLLRYNIRNTGRIYSNAMNRTNLGKDTIANSLLGVEPEYSEYKNANQCRNALTNIINRLTQKEYVSPSSIVVLSNNDYDKSILKNEDCIGAYRIDKQNNISIIDDDSIRFFTIREFKGLEADIIVFLNHTERDSTEPDAVKKCEEYVALTRPRYYLYVLNIAVN